MVDAADRTNRTGRTQHYDDDPPAKTLVTTSKSATHPVWDESRVPSSTTTSAVDTHALDKTFTESKPLAFEILRLKDAGAAPMTVMMRQAQWVQLAKKEGQSPPTAALDPQTATPAEIARATVWLSIGGYIPRAELERDGGKAYIASIHDAQVVHIARKILTPEQRLSETGKALLTEAAEQERQKYIGLDGRIGTEEQLVLYERSEALKAMYADTTLGSIAANVPNVVHRGQPPDVPKMRALGEAGDQTESLPAGRVAPQAVKH